jgi:hemolysin activation/secretion protein
MLMGLVWAVTATAQTNVPSPGQLVPRTFAPEEHPAEPTLELPAPEREQKSAVDRVQVNISRFALEDVDPVLAAIVDRVLSPMRNHLVQVDAIYTAIAEVEQDYVDRGHFLTRIVIPPQHVADGGELRLTVIHGFIQWLDLDGIPAGARARVAAILAPLVNNPNITRAAFERAMLVANEMPSLNLKARLRPGPQDGSVILVLSGQYRAMTGQVAIDNSLPKLLGRTSATLSSAYTAESGPISQVTMTASAPLTSDPISSASPRSLLVGGLRSAVGMSGAALDADFTWSRTKPTPTPGVIDTDSTYERASLRGSYPIVKTRATTLVAEAALDATSEEETATQFGSTLYDDELRVLRLGLSADHVFSAVLQASAGLELSRGLHGLGSRGPAEATSVDPLSQVGASDVFTKWEWHGSLHRELPARAPPSISRSAASRSIARCCCPRNSRSADRPTCRGTTPRASAAIGAGWCEGSCSGTSIGIQGRSILWRRPTYSALAVKSLCCSRPPLSNTRASAPPRVSACVPRAGAAARLSGPSI